MQITQDVTLLANPTLSAVVAGKNQFLEAAVNGTAAEATWELNGIEGKPNLILQLRDRSGYKSSGTFEPYEFKSEAILASRLIDLSMALKHIAEWRKTVDALFAKIRPWCEALSGNPILCKNVNVVAEQASGEYFVQELFVIKLAGSPARTIEPMMVITPIAAWVIGWDGRVDLIGGGDRFILEYSGKENAWYHVPNSLPYRTLPLTEVLFRELAAACFDDD